MTVLLRISRYCDRIVTSFGRLGAWAVLALVAVTLFDVVTRRFLVLGSTRLQELEWHFHTILMMFVFGYALLRNAHVRVDILRDRFDCRLKMLMELVGNLVFLFPFVLLVLFFSISFVKSSFVMGEASASMTGLSHRWIIKSTLIIAFVLVLLAGLSSTIRILAFFSGRVGADEIDGYPPDPQIMPDRKVEDD